jgi:hypothetical protein
MNCAVHTEVPAVAYCRTCGTALCNVCRRDVRGVIYCENCLAQRLQDVMPPATGASASGVPPQPGQVVVVGGGGPNPGLAAVLAAFFPFGVGAVYCGQYAKGLAHMVIFAFLVWGASVEAAPEPLFGLAIAFFYIYQVVDAYRTAKALQLSQPVPDPFGLGRMFGSGYRSGASNVPISALVLIGLGALFLLANLGLFHVGRLLFPLILIGLGAMLLLRRMGHFGTSEACCQCAHCRSGGAIGPVMLIVVGGLFLLEAVGAAPFGRTWPVLLLVYGALRIIYSNASLAGHIPAAPVAPAAPVTPMPQAPPPPSEVDHV